MKVKTLILLSILTISLATVAPQEKFKIDATFYNNSTAEINNVELINASRTTNFRYVLENFTLNAYDSEKNRLFSGKVPISFINHIRTEEGGIQTQDSNLSRELYIQYNPNITLLQISKNDEPLSSYNIPERNCIADGVCLNYCQKNNRVDPDCTCGDNICQSYENAEVCPQDCGSRVEVDSPDTVFEGFWIYILVALIFISAGLILLLRRYIEIEEEDNGEELDKNQDDEFDDLDLDRYNRGSEE